MMRRSLAALLITLWACAPSPSPTSQPPTSLPSATVAATPATRTPPFLPSPNPPTASPTTFTFDVENHASIGVVVSAASDTAATLPGFEPGQRGTISISVRDPQNGIGVEIQGTGCRLLASEIFIAPSPFTLLVEDGPQSGSVKLSTRAGASRTPMPLPSNSLVGCGG